MDINELLSHNKEVIIRRCFSLIVEAYPPETSEFLRYEKDRFINPVGFTIRSEMESIFNELTGKMDLDRLKKSLENIIKIRAIQGFTPSEAISFVFLLKRAMKETLMMRDARYTAHDENEIPSEFLDYEDRFDKIALLALDIYMKCREKIQEIRMKGTKVVYERE